MSDVSASRHAPHSGVQRGQSLVEFALVAPIFLLLVFAVLQLGIIFGAQNNLVNAARDAARKAATYRVNESSFDTQTWTAICASIEETFRDDISDYPAMDGDSPLLVPDIGYSWDQQANGDYFLVARVSATYAHPLYVPLIAYFLDGSDGSVDEHLTLSASEQMRIENPSLDAPTATPPPCPP